MSTLQPNPARLNQPSSAKRAYRNSRLREHLTHPTEQSTVIMFNRRMFYALSILKIGRSLAHQLAHRTNFSKPPSHNLHWQGKLHRRGNTRCRGPRGEGSNMNLQASAFVKKRKSTIVIHSNPCYITITHPANSNNSWGIPRLRRRSVSPEIHGGIERANLCRLNSTSWDIRLPKSVETIQPI
jgi:hypothetical protein